MRTTLNLDDDVVAAIERVRRDRGLGLSEAVNDLIRVGLARRPKQSPYVHRSYPMGLKVDITSISSVLDLLDHDEELS